MESHSIKVYMNVGARTPQKTLAGKLSHEESPFRRERELIKVAGSSSAQKPHTSQVMGVRPSLKEPFLPQQVARGLEYTLVLDLDETLVHFDQVINFKLW